MAKASTYSDAAPRLETCCTTCRMTFEVTPELLDSVDTRVRCGECLSIFDARANLREPDEDDARPGRPFESLVVPPLAPDGGPAPPNVTYADFDLFSGDARLPEVAYLDDTVDAREFDFDTVDFEENEAFGAALLVDEDPLSSSAVAVDALEAADAAHGERGGDTSASNFTRDADGADARLAPAGGDPGGATASEPIVPVLLGSEGDDAALDPDSPAPAEKPREKPAAAAGGKWVLRAAMVLLLGALLAGLYLARGWGALHDDPLVRPFLVAGCRVLDCTVPSRVDLAALQLLDKQVFTHPNEDSALVINLAFRNTAAFEQRYPVLVVRLHDRVGRRVAERDFAPEDYLDGWQAGDTLGAGRRLDISLEVGDPGEEADSYEFEFRESDA